MGVPCLNQVLLLMNSIKWVENKRENAMSQTGDLFPNLEVLELDYNQITHFMLDIFIQFGHLIQLNFSFNKLAKIQTSTFTHLS